MASESEGNREFVKWLKQWSGRNAESHLGGTDTPRDEGQEQAPAEQEVGCEAEKLDGKMKDIIASEQRRWPTKKLVFCSSATQSRGHLPML
jgi:hypothetical protein